MLFPNMGPKCGVLVLWRYVPSMLTQKRLEAIAFYAGETTTVCEVSNDMGATIHHFGYLADLHQVEKLDVVIDALRQNRPAPDGWKRNRPRPPKQFGLI